jgi:hypothetical protein
MRVLRVMVQCVAAGHLPSGDRGDVAINGYLEATFRAAEAGDIAALEQLAASAPCSMRNGLLLLRRGRDRSPRIIPD